MLGVVVLEKMSPSRWRASAHGPPTGLLLIFQAGGRFLIWKKQHKWCIPKVWMVNDALVMLFSFQREPQSKPRGLQEQSQHHPFSLSNGFVVFIMEKHLPGMQQHLVPCGCSSSELEGSAQALNSHPQSFTHVVGWRRDTSCYFLLVKKAWSLNAWWRKTRMERW